jgi:hypothetical protein
MNEDLSDITIVINGHKIPAHKFILRSCSHVFEDMIFSLDFKESNDKEIQIKDTNIEAFYVFLKCIYFDVFDSEDITDSSMAFDVYRLSHRYETQELSLIIEEELIRMISIENISFIYEFCLIYETNQLLKGLKKFFNQNKTQLIKEKLFLNYSFELIENFVEFANLSHNELMSVLVEIRRKYSNKDLAQFRKFIKTKLCSIQDLKQFKTIGLFGEKELIAILENKCEELTENNEDLKKKYKESNKTFIVIIVLIVIIVIIIIIIIRIQKTIL